MNRRGFVKLIALGLAGMTAVGIPTTTAVSALPEGYGHSSALWYMTQKFNDVTKGKGMSSFPQSAVVGADLWNALTNEIKTVERFTSDTDVSKNWGLYFKSCMVRPQGPGWYVEYNMEPPTVPYAVYPEGQIGVVG